MSGALFCLAMIVYRKTAKGRNGLPAKKYFISLAGNNGEQTGGARSEFLYVPQTLSVSREDDKLS